MTDRPQRDRKSREAGTHTWIGPMTKFERDAVGWDSRPDLVIRRWCYRGLWNACAGVVRHDRWVPVGKPQQADTANKATYLAVLAAAPPSL